MSFGSPIVFSEDAKLRRFVSLEGISARRDDPNSFNESLLQELIDATPNVLPVREYLPSTTTLFSLGREVPVDLGANTGYIDNLLVTNDGYLVIVETKLYRNPEGIREVIAQTLQYGMAVGQMPVMELEARIKRGQSPTLTSKESIRDCVSRQATEQNHPAALADDFDEALERHLRRGEMLLLIVSDGIHIGVERVTHWLNEQGNSSPFKFGLVELKFYTHGNERLVVPRTALKTREVSRHVVVVDVRPQAGAEASAVVRDEFRSSPTGGKVQESRIVKAAKAPLTKSQLLQIVSAENVSTVSQLLEQLEAQGLDQNGSPSLLRVGITYPDGGDFLGLAFLGQNDLYLNLPKRILKAIDDETALGFRRQGSQFGFYRPDQIENPNSLNVKYHQIKDNIFEFAAFLSEYRSKFIEALQADESS